MNYQHESWMNERQGSASTKRSGKLVDAFRNEYHVPSKSDEVTGGNIFGEADREQIARWKAEQEIINQQGEENLCSKD